MAFDHLFRPRDCELYNACTLRNGLRGLRPTTELPKVGLTAALTMGSSIWSKTRKAQGAPYLGYSGVRENGQLLTPLTAVIASIAR